MIRLGPERVLPPGVGRADSRLRVAEVAGRRLHLLSQRGSFADAAYDHGRLLAAEIEDGVLDETVATIRRATAPGTDSDLGLNLAAAAYRRLSDLCLGAVSAEFRAGVDAVAQGYRDGRAAPRFSVADVRDALVAIDVGNCATGLTARLRLWGAPENGELIGFLLGVLREARRDRGARVEAAALAAAYAADAPRLRPAGMGCTGLWAPGSRGADGLMLHARSFDGAFFEWPDHPIVTMVDERPAAPPGARWLRYAAGGTAGLIYAAGIGGINEAGLTVSLHQLSTVNYRAAGGRGRVDLMPFVVQRILREAATLDEAQTIVERSGHFGAWTILVGHAPSGQARRIEVSAGMSDPVKATRLAEADAQTNHFLIPAFRERHDFFGDAHFTPSLNKWLETRSRLQVARNALGGRPAAVLDPAWAAEALAGATDAAAGGARRSFGRVACKAYGQMGVILRADPARRPGRDEIWTTVGDRRPAPHATYAGFALDWDRLEARPIGTLRAGDADPVFAAARADYMAAFETVERPRDPDGRHATREPEGAALAAVLRDAEGRLSRAVSTAPEKPASRAPGNPATAGARDGVPGMPGTPSRLAFFVGVSWGACASGSGQGGRTERSSRGCGRGGSGGRAARR